MRSAKPQSTDMKKENTKTQKPTPPGVGIITASGGGMNTNSKNDSADLDPTSSIGSSGGATPTHAPCAGDSENGPGSGSAPGSAAPKDSMNDDLGTLNGGVEGGSNSNLIDGMGDHKTPDSCGAGNATPSSHCDGSAGGGAPPSVPSGSHDDTNGSTPQPQLHSQQQALNSLDAADTDFLEAFDSKDGGRFRFKPSLVGLLNVVL